jgi:hypothetical protein
MVVWVTNAAYEMVFRPVQNQNDRGRWLMGDAHSAKVVPDAASSQKYLLSVPHSGNSSPKGLQSPPIHPPHVNPVSGQRIYRFAAVVARFEYPTL